MHIVVVVAVVDSIPAVAAVVVGNIPAVAAVAPL